MKLTIHASFGSKEKTAPDDNPFAARCLSLFTGCLPAIKKIKVLDFKNITGGI